MYKYIIKIIKLMIYLRGDATTTDNRYELWSESYSRVNDELGI
jgi:hypothetical protein